MQKVEWIYSIGIGRDDVSTGDAHRVNQPTIAAGRLPDRTRRNTWQNMHR
jgi:hypothetical protein